jgi:hypothetical protein
MDVIIENEKNTFVHVDQNLHLEEKKTIYKSLIHIISTHKKIIYN